MHNDVEKTTELYSPICIYSIYFLDKREGVPALDPRNNASLIYKETWRD